MNSQERREGRYQRRKEKRRKKREDRCAALGSLAEVFSYRKMFFYGRKSATEYGGSSQPKTLRCTYSPAPPDGGEKF